MVDPFAGGGSIPLEALRVGCDAFASDLNPVACLILKVLLEDIPRNGPKLAEELRAVGKKIKEESEKELAEFYPPDPDGARPIAYLWARTVRCEAVGCGAEIPLMRSFWLCKKANRRRALRLVKLTTEGTEKASAASVLNLLSSEKGTWRFEIFTPKSEAEVRGGTVTRGNAACPCCNTILPAARVRAQLTEQHGGADSEFDNSGRRSAGARLVAVVALDESQHGRKYRLASQRDYIAARLSARGLDELNDRLSSDGLSSVPSEPLARERIRGNSGFRVLLYGMSSFGDLFNSRQKLCMVKFVSLLSSFGMSDPVRTALALAFNRVVMSATSLTRWNAYAEKMQHAFGRQTLPMVWDFAEVVPIAEAPGNWQSGYELVTEVAEACASGDRPGQVEQADATQARLPDEAVDIWFTDPPYYGAIHYADLSDFFFVWLKRTLRNRGLLRDPFDPQNEVTPKVQEIVQDEAKQYEGHAKDRLFFEMAMARAFVRGRHALKPKGLGCVVFAHKTTKGWEALLSGITQGRWVITGSWPITTEMRTRLVAMDTSALAASVHLICRPRAPGAGVGGWEEILRELPKRIGDWMERLSGEGIRGADLVFSCIGPALELFSKYDKVETAEGREVKLPEFLEKVWEVVGRTALQQILGTAEAKARNSAAGALEEDARLTALFLWTLQSTNAEDRSQKSEARSEDEDETEDEEAETKEKAKKGYVLIYDVVRRFAQPLGIHLESWDDRIIETKKGSVRLLPVTERADQLFGDAGTEAVARAIERSHGQDAQFTLFPDEELTPSPPLRGRRGRTSSREKEREAKVPAKPREATTLDRVHAAMLLQAGGQATALRAMLEAETQRSPDFLRLANALSALCPKDSEEKRLLDAMLLAAPK